MQFRSFYSQEYPGDRLLLLVVIGISGCTSNSNTEQTNQNENNEINTTATEFVQDLVNADFSGILGLSTGAVNKFFGIPAVQQNFSESIYTILYKKNSLRNFTFSSFRG